MTPPAFGPGEFEPSTPQLPPNAHTLGQADYSSLIWHQLRDLQIAAASARESQERLAIAIERLDSKTESRTQNVERLFSEIQVSFSDVKAEIRTMKASVDSTKSKVDDFVNWKNRIIGGALVLGFVVAVVWALASKVGDYIIFKPPAQATTLTK